MGTLTLDQMKTMAGALRSKAIELENQDSYERSPEDEFMLNHIYEEIDLLEINLELGHSIRIRMIHYIGIQIINQ